MGLTGPYRYKKTSGEKIDKLQALFARKITVNVFHFDRMRYFVSFWVKRYF